MPAQPPPLSSARLARVLGLDEDADGRVLVSRGRRLLAHLAWQRDRVGGEARAAVEREIDDLSRSLAAVVPAPRRDPGAPAPPADPGSHPRPPEWRRALLWLLVGAAGGIALFVAVGGSGPVTRAWPHRGAAADDRRARLVVDAAPSDAVLRLRRTDEAMPDREVPAGAARLTVEPGTYSLEVSRADCPDAWTSEVSLAAGQTRRFAPEICRGEAQLIVRSNVADDRLRIDGYDRGSTGPHAQVLGVGDHAVRVDKAGYQPWTARVRLVPNQQLELHATLAPQDGSSERSASPLPFKRVMPTPPPSASSIDPGALAAPVPLAEPAAASDRTGDGAEAAAAPSRPPFAEPGAPFWSRDGDAVRAPGGSTTWHDAVSRELLKRFDDDDSGRLDRVAESEAIPCAVWREIEREFDEGGLGLSMSHNYGFDGSEWIEGALGFSREIRSAAYARMRECGLAP